MLDERGQSLPALPGGLLQPLALSGLNPGRGQARPGVLPVGDQPGQPGLFLRRQRLSRCHLGQEPVGEPRDLAWHGGLLPYAPGVTTSLS